MKAVVLKDFFEGGVSAEALANDLGDALRFSGGRTFLNAEDMDQPFAVRVSHLVKVCDAFLDGKLSPENIEAIGFCLVGIDSFEFDNDESNDERIEETCYDWAAPEINYPITSANMLKFRTRLLTGENTFTSEDVAATA